VCACPAGAACWRAPVATLLLLLLLLLLLASRVVNQRTAPAHTCCRAHTRTPLMTHDHCRARLRLQRA
jgi:hypothetical protein